MGFGFCLAFFGLGGLFRQDFQGSLVFFRLAQGFYQCQRHLYIRDGGNGQAGSANHEAHFLLGAVQTDALLVGTGGIGLGSSPGVIGGIACHQDHIGFSGSGDGTHRLLAQLGKAALPGQGQVIQCFIHG